MKTRLNLIIIFAIITTACSPVRRVPGTTATEGDQDAQAAAFVRAFNTGNAGVLAQAVTGIFTNEFLANNGGAAAYAADRMELYRTYGPLEFQFTDTAKNPAVSWYSGRISRGWMGFQFQPSRGSDSARSLTTWRVRPVPFPEEAYNLGQVIDSMKSYLGKMSEAGYFSGSVTLSYLGNILMDNAWASAKNNIPVLPDTRFHTASVTKLFTAVLALQLVEAGRLHLEDTLGKYIPEYPEPYRSRVKIMDLLMHTSGIELDDDPGYLQMINNAADVEGLLAAQLKYLAGREIITPGREYNYTSEGYDLLGVIIERITGVSWAENIRLKIFVPARMDQSRVNMPADEGNFAIGMTSLSADLQTAIPGSLRNAMEILPRHARPSSGIWSNSRELHLFFLALLESRLLSEETVKKMLQPAMVTYENHSFGLVSWMGLGMQGEDIRGVRTVGHGGVVPGFSSLIEFMPANGWMLTVTSNTGESTAYLVFQRFLELTAGFRN